MSPITLIENVFVATVDRDGRELDSATVVIDGNLIAAILDTGQLNPWQALPGIEHVDGRGCLLTPGLVNTHHHLYQWITRGLAADHTLFQWLSALYPVWAGIDADGLHVAAQGALSWLALSGCTTTTDHHYVFPSGAGDLLEAEIEAAREVGLRFDPTRGSMDLGQSAGGLPPDDLVESIDTALEASAAAVERWHDPAPGSMVRIGLAPCSPFSVTTELLRQTAVLARARGVRMHTHLAETQDETDYCAQRFGCTPLDYMDELGWLGPDVWFAHGIHFDDAAIARLAGTGTGIAHCPTSNGRLGAGIARTRELLAAGVPVGLGVDGAASNESGRMLEEAHQALLFARAVGGPTALSTRTALELATLGGARLLGRADEIGSIEVGKYADLVLWDLRTLGHRGIDDPVAALVLGEVPPVKCSWVGGRPVVRDGQMLTVDTDRIAAAVQAAHHGLMGRVR
ncbi:8-oxoguanine deaminase [Mycobacteroides chelonae]|uniref:8-oxoguanine deaminase n=1 Tax=Mycobacteroides chelonae TaxID=1774 RepID=A0A1S1LZP7_MYCCH|nr:8-oxoguanine deaminase [Mycobacteroides chelonae]OHU28253.1 8-oxoguanine deaminase [Mycobacteroides chelonae]OHU63701.1 8-oxoguanine deaminase [Mycobacteroides chelonae]OHU76410.1 8-oxoguanine deaminase [Mycobacteroides chelonae]QQG88333.1 8-oxoguanine deaminase [Mycobacteroides chelonae]QQG93150.1 8-oxoguanine deaminase [Mycobacteroides chelonae]